MSGYQQDQSMSNNAVKAYESGIYPLSKIDSFDLKKAGWKGTVRFAKWLAKSGHWDASEWHHSSKFFNEVKFYNPGDLIEFWDDLDAGGKASLAAEFAKPVEESPAVLVKGEFATFTPGRKGRFCGMESFTGQLIKGWIHLDTGGKKKAAGGNITYSFV